MAWVHHFQPGDDVFNRRDSTFGRVVSVLAEEIVVNTDNRFGTRRTGPVTWEVAHVVFATAKPRRKNPTEVN